MRSQPALLFTLLLCACASSSGGASGGPEPAAAQTSAAPAAPAAPAAQAAAPAAQARTLERSGVLAPVGPAVISLWPQTWSGEFLVLEVTPPGARVQAGDVLLRMETRGYEQRLAAAERDMRSAELRHMALTERNALEEQSAASTLEQTRARLDRARRALEGYLSRELAFSKRQDELAALREKHGIEDQQDELAQVEKMYQADELVDDTEEIVLKRSRRDLESTIQQVKLSRDRRQYDDELSEALQVESRKEDVYQQELALERLVKSQEIERRSRADAEARSSSELAEQRAELERLRADGALFTLEAPSAGVLLHGKLEDYRPGATVPRLERGSRLSPRSDVLLVADPARMAVAIDVAESRLAALRSGASALVRPLSLPGVALSGHLELESWPQPKGGEEAIFIGSVQLAGPVPEGLLFGLHAKVELALEPPPEG